MVVGKDIGGPASRKGGLYLSPFSPSAASKGAGGFSLLELLVAVAIIAIALLAGFKGIGQSLSGAGELEARQAALWVADNQIARLRMFREFPTAGVQRTGTERQGTMDFLWEARFLPTANGDFLRVDVTVSQASQPRSALATRTGFLRRP